MSSLHQWFQNNSSKNGTPGWRRAGGKNDGGPCARQKGEKGPVKCVSEKKWRSMSKAERQSAYNAKRRADPLQGKRRGKAINVRTDKIERKNAKTAKPKRRTVTTAPKRRSTVATAPKRRSTVATAPKRRSTAPKTRSEKPNHDACYWKTKKSYKTWSAYAAGALVRCRNKNK